MSKIIFTRIEPGFVFEYNGVKLEAVKVKKDSDCGDCVIIGRCDIPCFPCIENQYNKPKQKHTLIYKEILVLKWPNKIKTQKNLTSNGK